MYIVHMCVCVRFHSNGPNSCRCSYCLVSCMTLSSVLFGLTMYWMREGNHRRGWNGLVMFLLTFHRQSRNKSIIGFAFNCVHVRSIGKCVQKTHKTTNHRTINIFKSVRCVCERDGDGEWAKISNRRKKINYVGSNHFAYARDRLSFWFVHRWSDRIFTEMGTHI